MMSLEAASSVRRVQWLFTGGERYMESMEPGKACRLRPKGASDFVSGYFKNSIFYEGLHCAYRAGFIDQKSNFFYRSSGRLSNGDFRSEIAGKLNGMTRVGLSGMVYELVEMVR
jgi:hypothetical protein